MTLKEDLLWLAGLIDGEGSFTVSIGPDKYSGLGIRPRFVLGIKADSSGWEKRVEKVLKKYEISYSLQIKRKHNSRWSDLYRIFIYRQEAVEKFSKLFYPYLTIKKRQAKLFSSLPKGRRTLRGCHHVPKIDWLKVGEFIEFIDKSRHLNERLGLAKWTSLSIRVFYENWEKKFIR